MSAAVPEDAAAAALDVIVRSGVTRYGERWRPQLQELTQALELAGVFEAMTWRDAERVAGAIVDDLAERPITALGKRSLDILTRKDGIDWDDRVRAADACHTTALECGRVGNF